MINLLKKYTGFEIDQADQDRFDQIFKELKKSHPEEEDAWGLNLEKAQQSFLRLWPLYKKYFKVRVFGTENVKDIPYMVVSNHTGQIAIDGLLISVAFATEIERPRILRSMVERFLTGIPFLGTMIAEGGAVLGDRQNCQNLLERGESVLVFPEGVRGIAKSTEDFYKLQSFTRGFIRLALQTKTVILPTAVIGAEEFFPYVYQAKGLSKMLGLPALPISANYIPLPSPVDIYLGEPYHLPEDLSADSSDKLIDEQVQILEDIVKKMITKGLESRRTSWMHKKD
jgi:1-acyl-sn-glycerol-3-phosphate acyltransferase